MLFAKRTQEYWLLRPMDNFPTRMYETAISNLGFLSGADVQQFALCHAAIQPWRKHQIQHTNTALFKEVRHEDSLDRQWSLDDSHSRR